ncbi:9815_t:CDS:2 [Acaulospora colombiana]|uniref:9815_t:CDS:1 n=1 Tax=Acaulospora colombiana TaxID=27376 RepID=A0ACA9MHG9_9GLOM|nr:9815_t:CDS:2 [Acaulospora colombiana]
MGRNGYDVEIFGMEGIPAADVAAYKRKKEQEFGLPVGYFGNKTGEQQKPGAKRNYENRIYTFEELRGMIETHKQLMGREDDNKMDTTADASGPVLHAAPQTYAVPPIMPGMQPSLPGLGMPGMPPLSMTGPPGAPPVPIGMSFPPGGGPPGGLPPGGMPPGLPPFPPTGLPTGNTSGQPPFPPGMLPPGMMPPGFSGLPPPEALGGLPPPSALSKPNAGGQPPAAALAGGPGLPMNVSGLTPGLASLPPPSALAGGMHPPTSISKPPASALLSSTGSNPASPNKKPMMGSRPSAPAAAFDPVAWGLKAGTVLEWEDMNFSPLERRAEDPTYSQREDVEMADPTPTGRVTRARAKAQDFLD